MDSGKQTDGFSGEGVGGWSHRVMGIKEGTFCDKHWVLYSTNESLNSTSTTNDVLYSGQLTEHNEKKSEKTVNEIKSQFFEKRNKMDKLAVRHTKEKKRENTKLEMKEETL